MKKKFFTICHCIIAVTFILMFVAACALLGIGIARLIETIETTGLSGLVEVIWKGKG